MSEEKLDYRQRRDLWSYLKHGSDAHKQWLWDAIQAWCDDKPAPKPYE